MGQTANKSLEELQRDLKRARERAREEQSQLEKQIEQLNSSQSLTTVSPRNSRHLIPSLPQSDHQLVGSKRYQDGAAPCTGPRSGNTMPRSISNMGFPMNSAGGRMMERAFSHQSAPTQPMIWSMSSGSDRALPVSPARSSLPNVNASMMGRFHESQDEPATAHIFSSSLQQSSPTRLLDLQEDTLPDLPGTNPEEWIAAMGDDFSSGIVRPEDQFMSATDALRYQATLPVSSDCPSLASGTSAAEQTPLTRSNSSHGEGSLFDALDMQRMGSTRSQTADFGYGHYDGYSAATKRLSCGDALRGVGASLPPPAAHQYAPSAPLEAVCMSRSGSNVSNASNRSTSSQVEKRAKEARERQIANGRRTQIRPKLIETEKTGPSQHTAAKKDGKMGINKSTYQRRKPPRVFCDKCNEKQDGFRGDHELRRHTNAKHEVKVKKFVCRDPATVGIKTDLEARHPLSKCKQCLTGKKYGAYYNAAAHLRRTHFKPKSPRSKRGGGGGEDEKRAGKGGGDWPPMAVLKHWMEEVEVSAADAADADADADADVDVDDVDGEDADADVFEDARMSSVDIDYSPTGAFIADGEYPLMDPTMTNYFAESVPISSASTGFEISFLPSSPRSQLSYASSYAPTISSGNTVLPSHYQFDEQHVFPLEMRH